MIFASIEKLILTFSKKRESVKHPEEDVKQKKHKIEIVKMQNTRSNDDQTPQNLMYKRNIQIKMSLDNPSI